MLRGYVARDSFRGPDRDILRSPASAKIRIWHHDTHLLFGSEVVPSPYHPPSRVLPTSRHSQTQFNLEVGSFDRQLSTHAHMVLRTTTVADTIPCSPLQLVGDVGLMAARAGLWASSSRVNRRVRASSKPFATPACHEV